MRYFLIHRCCKRIRLYLCLQLFHEIGEHWVYDYPLIKQLRSEKLAQSAAEAQDEAQSDVTTDDELTNGQEDEFDDVTDDMVSAAEQ